MQYVFVCFEMVNVGIEGSRNDTIKGQYKDIRQLKGAIQCRNEIALRSVDAEVSDFSFQPTKTLKIFFFQN